MKPTAAVACLSILACLGCADDKRGDVISASGTIEAREVRVSSKISGQIKELSVDEGARVEPGDRLALIDHESLDLQLRQAEAGVDFARAELALLNKGARQEDVRLAQEALNQAGADLKIAEEDARRMRALAEKESVTVKQKEDAEARHVGALARYNAAGQALDKVRRLVRPEEIQAAEARLAQAVAAADLLRKTVADCTITAPVGGIVTRRAMEAGEFLTPAATILTIAALDTVHLMIYITAEELGRVRLGDPVDVRIDAFPERNFPGRITYISPEAEFTPKNIQTREDRVKLVFALKVEIDNREGFLKPGLPADGVIRPAPPGAAKEE